MSDLSNYLRNQLLGFTLCHSSFTPANTYFAALATDITTSTDTVTELATNTAYTRKPISFGAVGNGVCYNNAAVQFTAATTGWGTIGWLAIYDASTGGNLLLRKNFEVPQSVNTGMVFSLGYGQVSIQLI